MKPASLRALFAGVTLLGVAASCSTGAPPARTDSSEPIGTTSEALSDPVGEKLIPLRFINLLDSASAPDNELR